MAYVDGFVIPIPKKSLPAYKKMARTAGKVWKEHGAIDYKECIGDDLNVKFGLPLTKLAKVKNNETVVFSFIVYKSRSHRDAVNKKVMSDPRLAKMMKQPMPFDDKRMSWGGFKVIVDM
jgi:uncharacterized protein YbaA (DUF1428 family)